MARWTKGQSGRKQGEVTRPTDVQKRYEATFLDSMDGRTEVTRSLRQRLGQLVADLGGVSNLSYMEQSLCKRIVHLERVIEGKELTLAHNGTIEEGSYYSAITTLSSLLSKLGLKRRARKIQSLDEYLKRQPEPQAPQPAPDDGATTKEN